MQRPDFPYLSLSFSLFLSFGRFRLPFHYLYASAADLGDDWWSEVGGWERRRESRLDATVGGSRMSEGVLHITPAQISVQPSTHHRSCGLRIEPLHPKFSIKP